MEELMNFLADLARNNNREWFAENKDRYIRVKKYADALTQKLINRVAEFDHDAAYLTPADCTYRIYRDTRFSADKTPYKAHIGIFINPPYGKKSLRLGYYLHLEPGGSFVAGGTICLPSKTVTAIRRSIADNIDEYLSIIRNPEFHKFFPVVGANPVKTAPKGFDRKWEHIELVKPRDFVVDHKLTSRELYSPDLVDQVVALFRIVKPFNDFINYTIDENDRE